MTADDVDDAVLGMGPSGAQMLPSSLSKIKGLYCQVGVSRFTWQSVHVARTKHSMHSNKSETYQLHFSD